jgi:hypothetical protein
MMQGIMAAKKAVVNGLPSRRVSEVARELGLDTSSLSRTRD